VACAESRNDDYDTEDAVATAAKRSLASAEETRVVSKTGPVKQKQLAVFGTKPRSVTFRPATDEMKGLVITNAMISRRLQEEHEHAHTKFVNERVLGRVRTVFESDGNAVPVVCIIQRERRLCVNFYTP